jgi:hypothetical protein
MLREGMQCADQARAEIGPDTAVEAEPGPAESLARLRPGAKNNTSEKRSHCQRERNLSGTLPTGRPPAAGSQSGLGLGSAREQGAARGLGGARRSLRSSSSRPRRPRGMEQVQAGAGVRLVTPLQRCRASAGALRPGPVRRGRGKENKACLGAAVPASAPVCRLYRQCADIKTPGQRFDS